MPSRTACRRARMRQAPRSKPRWTPLAGVGGDLVAASGAHDLRLTDPAQARAFVEQTGIDALAVNVGQVHLHGRETVRLDLDRLEGSRRAAACRSSCTAPRRSIRTTSARRSVSASRKINVGSRLKQSYFDGPPQARACRRATPSNPYEIIGSGLDRRRPRRGTARHAARGRAADEAVRQRGQGRGQCAMKHPIVIPHLGATGGDVTIVEWRGRRRARRSGPARRPVQVETDKATDRSRGVPRRACSGSNRRRGRRRSARRANRRLARRSRPNEPIDEPAPLRSRSPSRGRHGSPFARRAGATTAASARERPTPSPAPDRRPSAEPL